MNDLVREGTAMPSPGQAADGGRRRLEWFRLLTKQVAKYTRGESSSVPVETAGSLLNSLLYTIALAGGLSCEKPLEMLYDEGRDMLARKIKKAHRLYYLVQKTLLNVDAPCYREAIKSGIPGFFRGYDPEFSAHETPGDFDYPVSVPCAQTGITWMIHYLDALYWENVFCLRFPLGEVEGALRAQGVLGVAIPVNVFEPVFAAALFKHLLPGGQTSSLVLQAGDNERLMRRMAPLSGLEITVRVRNAGEKMMTNMKIESGPFRALLAAQAETLALRLVPAVRHGDLSSIFPLWDSPPPPVVLMDGDPMEDTQFRALAGEMAACRYFSDKLLLVRRQVHSLWDLIGLMECGSLCGVQMRRMFSLLDNGELCAMLHMGPGSVQVQGRWVFPDACTLPAHAPVWEKSLYGYLADMDPARRQEIIRLAGQVRLA